MSIRRGIVGLACPAAGFLLIAAPIRAQGVTGAAIQGQVLGPDSTPVAEAVVLASNTSNGERWRTGTTVGGRYQFEHLSVGGPYRIEVQAIGFEPVRRDGVFLSLGQRLRADFTLHAGVALLQPITVQAADDPLINSGRTGPSRIVGESTLARLPILGRNLLPVARLSPIVTGDGAVAGQNSRLTGVQVDGAAGGDLLGGLKTPGQDFGLRTVAVEAVKEVQVLAAPFDVRFGWFSTGLVNVVTKSGSNRFEGSLSGYFTSTGLVGKDAEGNRGEEFSASDVNAAFGGPILRDRAAFFVQGGVGHTEFPLATPRIGTDTTGGADSAGVGFRRSSITRLQEVMRESYGVEAGDTDPYPLAVPAGNVFGKLTLQLGVNSRLELSHEYSRSTPQAVDISCRVAYRVFCLSSTAFHLLERAHLTRVSWVTAPRPGVSNDLLLARSWYQHRCRTTDFPLVFVSVDAGDLGVGGNSLCTGDYAGQEVLELTDNLSVSAGSHRFTVGAHGELVELPTLQNLLYFFAPSWHFQSMDSLAAGTPDGYGGIVEHPAREGQPLSTLRTQLISPYVQDQWSVTPKLLLTLGLRADLPFVSGHPLRNPALQQALGIDNTRTPSGHPLWSPRLGMSYDLRGDGRTLLRGGIGLFAGRPAYRWFDEVYVHTGLDAIQVSCDSSNVPPFVTDVHRQPSACAGDEGMTQVGGPVNVFDPAFRFPRSLKLALGADHRLPGGWVGTVDLLFTRGVNQLDLRELNLAPPAAVALGEADRPLYGTLGDDGLLAPTRLSLAFGRVTQVRNARGDRALSVTAQLQKHFPGGKEVSASYSYTRARDRLSATEDGLDGNLDAVILDGTLEHRRLAPSAWGAPHRVTLLVTADLPLHFRVALFYEGIAGAPFTYRVDGDANGDGYWSNDAVYVPVTAEPGGDIALVAEDDQGQLVPAPESEYAALNRFIESEPCLRRQRGRVLRRNSCRNPWGSYTEARFSRIFPAAHGRSLELALDVFNLLHLLDRDWGLIRGADDTPLLQLAGYDPAGGRGTYRRLERVTGAVIDGTQWRMQLGARVMF
jgi:hypothetical protein